MDVAVVGFDGEARGQAGRVAVNLERLGSSLIDVVSSDLDDPVNSEVITRCGEPSGFALDAVEQLGDRFVVEGDDPFIERGEVVDFVGSLIGFALVGGDVVSERSRDGGGVVEVH